MASRDLQKTGSIISDTMSVAGARWPSQLYAAALSGECQTLSFFPSFS